MFPKKTSLALVALAAALPLSLPRAVQAGPLLGPGSEVSTENVIEKVRNKTYHQLYWKHTQTPPADTPSAAPVQQGAAHKATVKSGLCGPYMYWDKKANKCADARDNKK
jgi:hypothetical protein